MRGIVSNDLMSLSQKSLTRHSHSAVSIFISTDTIIQPITPSQTGV